MAFFHQSLLFLLTVSTSVLASNYFHGISASGSLGNSGNFVCRSQQDWNVVARDTKNQGFKSFRIYSFDCEALERASSAAASQGVKVLAGIYVDGSNKIGQDTERFINAVNKYGADRYEGLTVGNEIGGSAQDIMTKVNDVRNRLMARNVRTPVSTVHTWVAVRDNPILCSGDFVGANAHVFFDGNRVANQAGDFIFQVVVPSLKKVCPGKPIMITESGWPSRGGGNSKAVASLGDERTALASLNCAAKSHSDVAIYAFEYDDQLWKHNDNERSFGIFGKIGLKDDILKQC